MLANEVAIRQHTEWDGTKFVGYIDLGTRLDEDSMPVAKEALTFMVAGVNDSFKLPVAYFVVFKLKSTLHCETCTEALTGTGDRQVCSLNNMKTKGGLVVPLQDVTGVCIYCERCFHQSVTAHGSSLSNVSVTEITQVVLSNYASKQWFHSLQAHMLECVPTANHVILLIKSIVDLHEKHRKISRQVSTKLVLFSGQ